MWLLSVTAECFILSHYQLHVLQSVSKNVFYSESVVLCAASTSDAGDELLFRSLRLSIKFA